MDSNDPRYHAAPLLWLTKQVLHRDTTLADRVRALRQRRRKPKPVNESLHTMLASLPEVSLEELVGSEEQPAGQVQEVT